MDPHIRGLFDDQDDEVTTQDKARDFIKRYEEGAPADNVGDEEALRNFQAVAGKVTPKEFEESAAEALERISPQERREFANLLNRAGVQDVPATDDPREIARYTSQVQSQSPDLLTGLLGGLLGGGGQGLGGLLGGSGQGGNQGLGGLLDGILGGQNQGGGSQGQGQGVGDLLGGLLGGGNSAGDVAGNTSETQGNVPARGQAQGQQADGLSELLQSPVARSILAGIAAMAMKRLMGRR